MAEHILLIEDDRAVARSLREGLERHGYGVTHRETGHDGLEFALEQHPHLIILDVRLPDGSGFDFCRQMRAKGLRQPILMLTVQRDEIDKVLGLEMGADDYITKPFSLREVVSRVRAQIRRAYGELATTPSDRLLVGDLVIDRSRAQVWRADQLIHLTPIEFRLLVYLAEHGGQVLTRAQILDGVWGYAHEVEDERTVNVHVRRLREKIEIEPGRPRLLLTVPGQGYRLAQPAPGWKGA